MGKILLTLFSLFLALASADWDDVWQKPSDPSQEIWHEKQDSRGLRKFPGLKVRLAQGEVEMLRQNLLEYGLSLYDYDYSGGTHGVINTTSFPSFGFYNLRHKHIKFDAMDFKFEFVNKPQRFD